MLSIRLSLIALFTIHLHELVLAAPLLESVDLRADGVCGNGIYGELAPILGQQPIAQAFCTAVFPVCRKNRVMERAIAAVTSTTTKNSQGSRFTSTIKTTTRRMSTVSVRATTPPTSTRTTMSSSRAATTTSKTSTSVGSGDRRASAWSKCQKQPQNVISTLCSCIQTKPCTSTTSTTKSVISTSTTSKASTVSTTSSASITSSTSTTDTTTSTTTTSTTESSIITTTTSTSESTTSTTSSTTTTTTTTGASCTQLDNPIYTARNGKTFVTTCNKGFNQFNPNSPSASTFTDCIEACSEDANCAAIDYSNFQCGTYPTSELSNPYTDTDGAVLQRQYIDGSYTINTGMFYDYGDEANKLDKSNVVSLQACESLCDGNDACAYFNYYQTDTKDGQFPQNIYCELIMAGNYALKNSFDFTAGKRSVAS